MQLVGGRVLVLRPGAGPDKGDLVVDAAKVEELMGVPPEKVADVMALMGDSIDNIPGAKGIGEKGARELIRRFGSVEAALRPRRRGRRQALSRSADQRPRASDALEAAGDHRRRRSGRARSRSPRHAANPIRRSARPLRRAGLHFAAARSARRHHGLDRRHRLRRARFARRAAQIARPLSRQAKSRRVAHARCRRARNRRLRRARGRLRTFDRSRASRVLPGATTKAKCSPRCANFSPTQIAPKSSTTRN